MHSRLRRLIILFAMLLCLPLQGLAAVTLPVCPAHGQTMEMQADAGHAAEMPHCVYHHGNDHQTKNTPCEKCFSCHLSVAQAIIPFSLSVDVKATSPMVSGLFAEIPDSIPSSLFRPPRPALA